jgi:hypothetical protein
MRSALLGVAAAAFVVTSIQGQQPKSILGPPSEANHFIATPQGWVHPKTPWGDPDIQATLDMMQANSLTLERCAGGGRGGGAPCDKNRAWRSEEEYNQAVAAASKRVDQGRALIEQGNFGRALLSGVTDPNLPQRQTSLIMDPPDGQLPPLTPEGKRRALAMGSSWALPAEDPVYEDPLDFDFWDNCRSRGMPSSMMPYRYNGGFRITQAPGVVVFDLEMIHDARVIYTDGRPALGGPIKQYMGESRGRWEGNTLVVETTNYKEGPPLINLAVPGSPAGNRFPVSDRMKTTERITRLNNDMWLYEIKTEDPVVLTRPFTVRYPMKNDPNYEWWEYACHEGNTIIQNYSETNKHEIENPPQEPPVQTAKLTPEATKALVGRWTGKPEVDTVDYNVFLEFTSNPDGTVQGKLIGTDLKTFRGKVKPTINKALRSFRVGCVGAGGGRGAGGGAPGGGGRGGGAPGGGGRGAGAPGAGAPAGGPASSCEQPGAVQLNFELPNTQPWTFAGQLAADGSTITGSFSSAQGGVPVVFKKQ